jgi:hypothetical protein
MSDWVVYLGLAILGAWFRYNFNLSKASADISRAMAGSAIEPGLQDAITPPILAFNYYVCFVATLVAYLGLPILDDWSVFTVLLVLCLGGACASPPLVPSADSPYWVRVMHRSLLGRAQRYARRGKEDRADAMMDLAGRLERIFPDAPQRQAVTK